MLFDVNESILQSVEKQPNFDVILSLHLFHFLVEDILYFLQLRRHFLLGVGTLGVPSILKWTGPQS